MKREDFYDLAAELEAECGDWEQAEGLSESSKNALLAKVAQMDAKESKKEIKTVKEVKCKPIKKRYLLVLAAALVLVMGIGVAGDRAWVSDKTELERASEMTTKIDNEEKDSILREEEEIYQEISEKLGIATIRLGYYPDEMTLDSYMIMENTGWAYVNYLYEGKIITVQMVKEQSEISGSVQWDGQYEKMEEVDNQYGYQIDTYCLDGDNGNYGAEILYGNGYYNIFGCFSEKSEFFLILRGIFFKNL